MRLNKKISALIVMLFLGAMATQVIAQPSIPRRYSTTKSKKKTRTSSSSTVWGTQYDWLGQRYATWNDIKYLDAGQIRVLKNSIYARHGYIFQTRDMIEYFNAQPWYTPRTRNVRLSEIETYNVQLIKSVE